MKTLRFIAKRWLLCLIVMVIGLIVGGILKIAQTREKNYVDQLVSSGNYVEAIKYVYDKGRTQYSITAEEQAYIDVFKAALPGTYRGSLSNGEYIWLFPTTSG